MAIIDETKYDLGTYSGVDTQIVNTNIGEYWKLSLHLQFSFHQ
jgi:hypothetical protein